jgi:nitrite reductase/ring-hydroxylating ferredoxin subunit
VAGGERVKVCESGRLVEGGDGARFELPRGGPPVAAFAVRYRGRVRAYLNECPHARTQLDWVPGRFFDHSKLYLICATHGAQFRPEDGVCVAGPCKGSRLVAVAVREEAGAVLADGEADA